MTKKSFYECMKQITLAQNADMLNNRPVIGSNDEPIQN